MPRAPADVLIHRAGRVVQGRLFMRVGSRHCPQAAGKHYLGETVALKPEHLDGEYDRHVECYELSWLLERIQDVLNANGVLTVADYREALTGARNDGSKEPTYGEN